MHAKPYSDSAASQADRSEAGGNVHLPARSRNATTPGLLSPGRGGATQTIFIIVGTLLLFSACLTASPSPIWQCWSPGSAGLDRLQRSIGFLLPAYSSFFAMFPHPCSSVQCAERTRLLTEALRAATAAMNFLAAEQAPAAAPAAVKGEGEGVYEAEDEAVDEAEDEAAGGNAGGQREGDGQGDEHPHQSALRPRQWVGEHWHSNCSHSPWLPLCGAVHPNRTEKGKESEWGYTLLSTPFPFPIYRTTHCCTCSVGV